MKYKTFRSLVLAGVVVVAGGAVAFALLSEKKAPPPPPPPPPATPMATPTAAPAPAPSAPAPAAAATSGALADYEQRIRAKLAEPAQQKVKDLLRGKGPKVNLYSDDGARWSRVKIDLDRDEKWDEKWTLFPDGAIEKQRAPADDESYTETFVLQDGAWARK